MKIYRSLIVNRKRSISNVVGKTPGNSVRVCAGVAGSQVDIGQVVLRDGEGPCVGGLPDGLPGRCADNAAPIGVGQVGADAQRGCPDLLCGGEGAFGAPVQFYPTWEIGGFVVGLYIAVVRRRRAEHPQRVGCRGEGGAGLQLDARPNGDTEPIRHVKCRREGRDRAQLDGIDAPYNVYGGVGFRPNRRAACLSGVQFEGQRVGAVIHGLPVVLLQVTLNTEGADDTLRLGVLDKSQQAKKEECGEFKLLHFKKYGKKLKKDKRD